MNQDCFRWLVWKPALIDSVSIRKLFAMPMRTITAPVLLHGCIRFHLQSHGSWDYRSTETAAHLHTQFNEEIPYDTIDMDFMNENQSAHGDRNYGHIVSRMGIERRSLLAIEP